MGFSKSKKIFKRFYEYKFISFKASLYFNLKQKIVGSDKTLNLEKKIRLQLYYSQTQYKLNTYESLSPAVYYLYKHGPRVKYPSSLHVTIKSILAPKSFQPGVGSVHVFEQEEFLKNLEPENPHETYSNANKGSAVNLLEDKHQDHETDTEILNPANLKKNTVVWSRIAGLPCRIPNDLELTLKTPKKGCYSIKFSTSGSHLACACVEENNVTPVFIYEIPTGKLLMKYYGHFGLIYELSWSKLDKYLVTASNDATARQV
jgi:jouberin